MSGKLPATLKSSILALIVALLAAFLVLAASNNFSIPWWTVDDGGGNSQGGDYAISGTIGQPDVSPLMSGGDYTVVGGFWGGPVEVPIVSNYIYVPLVIR
jgi:hypothetical protein